MYEQADYLLVLGITSEAAVHEVYNGPGEIPWKSAGPIQKNGQRSVSLVKLRSLSSVVRPEDRIPVQTNPPWFKREGDATAGHGV
jgi:hypothetical protein